MLFRAKAPLERLLLNAVDLSFDSTVIKTARSLLLTTEEVMEPYAFTPEYTPEWSAHSDLPDYPLYNHLVQRCDTYMYGLSFPKVQGMADDAALKDEHNHDSLDQTKGFLRTLMADELDDDVLVDVFTDYLDIGLIGVARVMGMRLTPGTVTAVQDNMILPPPVAVLCGTFSEHVAGSRLTVGAKALTKHIPRDSTSHWGSPGGSEEDLVSRAEEHLRNILQNPAWVNLHMLPHGIPTYEVRLASGYGVRWSLHQRPVTNTDDETPEALKWEVKFRGFLEPHQENGHEEKWRH